MNDNVFEIKSLNVNLPEPIALNCWKHHLGYVKSCFSTQTLPPISQEEIKESILFIGDSLLDIYVGILGVHDISRQVLNHHELIKISNLLEYQSWIKGEAKSYKNIYISDGSSWTLRLGTNDKRYIHIHPSRYSCNTLRVRGSTLKTVIAYVAYFGLSDRNITVEKVNIARLNLTKLPPIKSTSSLIAVNRIFKLFFD